MSLTRTKYLYFSTGDGANSTGEASYFPVTSFLGFDPISTTQLNMYFKSMRGQNAHDKVTLTIILNSHKVVMDAILNQMNLFDSHSSSWSEPIEPQLLQNIYENMDWKLTICDKDNDTFLDGNISDCTITYGTCDGCGGTGTMDKWVLSDGSTTQDIDDGETVTFADSTFVNNVVSATNTVTTSLSATGTADATRYLRGDNSWKVPTDTTYSAATDSVLGLVKLEDSAVQSVAASAITTTALRTYGIQLNSSSQAVVNVPWTDTTQYMSRTTSFSYSTGGGAAWAVYIGGGAVNIASGNTACTWGGSSNTLTDDQTIDACLYDENAKQTIQRIYGWIECDTAGGSVQIKEATLVAAIISGAQTFTISSVLGTEAQLSANTYYPFEITSGFGAPGIGMMKTYQLLDRAGGTRVYKGQFTVEYIQAK